MFTSHRSWHDRRMKSFFSYAIAFLFIFIAHSSQVHGFENESILDKSQLIIANKYADRYCSAKKDNFFEGLDNEKTLKYSYYKYIGLQNKEIYSRNLFETIIHKIREKCPLTNEEEREINDFFLEKSISVKNLYDK